MALLTTKICGVGVDDLWSASGSETQEFVRANGSASGVRTRSMENGSFSEWLGSVIKSGKRDRWAGDAGLEGRR
jgi:hypothetical protein